MTQANAAKRYVYPHLDMRLDVDFYGNISKNFSDHALKDVITGEETAYRAYSINNHWDGCKHIGFTIQNLSDQHCVALANSIGKIREELAKIQISTQYDRDPEGEMESTDELPWSSRVFIYTDSLKSDKSRLLSIFRNAGLRAVITDDVRWSEMLSSQKPEAFISHDSRDKDHLARPLAHALGRLKLVAWYDEFSLRPGDRLSASIDKGLTECNRAVFLITPNFLGNASWTSVEMSTLLTREVTEKNLIIPVWSGVDAKTVAARSARLSDLVAIRTFADIDELATRIFSLVRSTGERHLP
jgi:hypothetical protein